MGRPVTVGVVLRAVATLTLLAVAGLAVPGNADAQTDPTPPPTVVPPLPEPAEPVLGGVGPVGWRACDAVGLAFGLTVLSGTLAGAPPELTVPVNEAFTTASGPALATFFEACQQIPLSEEPPSCETDEEVPALPTLGRPLPPFSTLVDELSALEGSLGEVAPGLDGALSERVADLLACTERRDPEDEPTPTPAVEPPAPSASDPFVDGAGLSPTTDGFGVSARPATPSLGTPAGGDPAPAVPTGEHATTDAVGAYQPAASSAPANDGTTLAVVLLLLTALAGGVWTAAGAGSSGTTPADR